MSLSLRSMRACCLASMFFAPASAPERSCAQTLANERFEFGAYAFTLSDLAMPTGAAVAADGSIFVADSGNHRIAVFSSGGSFVRSMGALGDGASQLRWPTAVVIDAQDRLLVADSGNDRIAMFGIDGTWMGSFGTRGRGPGEFCQPRAIAVDGQRIVVADTGNQRVQVFDREGTHQLSVGGSAGRERELFKRPTDVALDEGGRIYVVDADRASVTVIDREGSVVRSFGDYGPFIGLLNEPMGVAVAGDEILVIDSANHRVQFFDERGESRRQWGIHDPTMHEGNGRIHYPHDLALGGTGERAISVICEPLEHRCQVFKARLPGDPPQPRQANVAADVTHFGARLAIDGPLVLIPEPEHHYIYVLDMRDELPVMVSQSGTRGVKFGQFLRPGGLIANYPDRTVTVTDPSLSRLQIFSLAFNPDEPPKFDPFFARFVKAVDFNHERFAQPTPEWEWPLVPETLRRDRAGRYHVLDPRNATVAVFDEQWQFVRSYGRFGSGTGQLRQPSDLAFSPDGQIAYVVDSGNFRVSAFDADGRSLMSFGAFGDDEGEFRFPFGIVVDEDGNICVSDMLADRIQKFDASGRFIGSWGRRGWGKDEMWRPMGMAIDQRGRLIVIDHGNHRAQMFALDGLWLGSFGAGRAVLREQMED